MKTNTWAQSTTSSSPVETSCSVTHSRWSEPVQLVTVVQVRTSIVSIAAICSTR